MPKIENQEKTSKSYLRRFWWPGLLLFFVLIVIIFLLLNGKKDRDGATMLPGLVSLIKQTNKNDEPPLLIKNLPINFAPYDPVTGMAGDFKFAKQKFSFDIPYLDYGFIIPASPDYPAEINLQPTFVAPLGTKVRSIVDGYVVSVGKVWSGDYSIGVGGKRTTSKYVYETEHVINPIVKVGDKVKAGQVIAEVSDYDSKNTPGYGTVEMGILRTGNPPFHLCPYLYLDPSIKDKIIGDLDTLYNDWNKFNGKQIYNSSNFEAPGCIIADKIEG